MSAPNPGTADLVGRKRHQIGAQRGDVAGDTARRLNRIDMDEPARGMHLRGGLRHRLDHAGLVVGEHQRDQRPDRPAIAARSAVRSSTPALVTGICSAAANRPPLRSPKDARSPTPAACRPSAGDSASMLASVPPEVNTTSPGAAPTSAATLLARVFHQAARRPPGGMDRRRIAGQASAAVTAALRLRPQPATRVPVEIDPVGHRKSFIWSRRLYQSDPAPMTMLILLAFGTRDHVRNRRPPATPPSNAVAPVSGTSEIFAIVLISYVRHPLPSSMP